MFHTYLAALAALVATDDFDPYEQQCEPGAPCSQPGWQAADSIAGILDAALIILALAGLVTLIVRHNKKKSGPS